MTTNACYIKHPAAALAAKTLGPWPFNTERAKAVRAQRKQTDVQPSETCPICLEDSEQVALCTNLGDFVNADGVRQGHGVCVECLSDYLASGRTSCVVCRQPHDEAMWIRQGLRPLTDGGDVVMADAPGSVAPLPLVSHLGTCPPGTPVWSLKPEDYTRNSFIQPQDACALSLGRGRIEPPGPIAMLGAPEVLYRIVFDNSGGVSHGLYTSRDFAPESRDVPPDVLDGHIGSFHPAFVVDGILRSAVVLRRIPVATPTAFYLLAVLRYHDRSFLTFMLATSAMVQDGLYRAHVA